MIYSNKKENIINLKVPYMCEYGEADKMLKLLSFSYIILETNCLHYVAANKCNYVSKP